MTEPGRVSSDTTSRDAGQNTPALAGNEPGRGLSDGLPDPTDPAVVAIVDHFVQEGFDPSYADYCEVAQVALRGLYVEGFTVTPWPSPSQEVVTDA